MNNNNTNLAKNLWIEWQLFKKNEQTNPTLQMKKQGIMSKTDQYAEFTYRPNATSPPSMQEFYESVINGIIKRFQLGLYQGEYPYYNELQSCLHEFIRLMNFKSEILVEVFQSITNLNLSKETFPNVVVPCASCGMFIYIVQHCTICYSAFYCDKTCLKNGRQKHESECQQAKITPSIIYPLQVEIHCGSSLGDDVKIYFQHERKLSLLYRGQKFLNSMYKILLKNRWLKNNGYNIIENETSIQLQSTKKVDMKPAEDQGDPNFSDEDLYLKMPCVQEIKVIFLNQGAILQDIIKETYNLQTNFIHIYYFPI
ncbi:unnamed protein product (macronuclear) [Paramecium tetraurelia]|uniref:MYND-type domain-containing protein n=1 Tax=Paramecium tetraurelia TaxID=5888 RepID=A0BPF6_PARTE|nr:uncharacterized protein GSPATT00005172001 [Paramecium tetraurelia]CAK60423.1 unnamed protein product [Paramecium tetraurelia]|eukprot:XP_001427821.1 hypothetical protein (macronuclear) [Paramecium tetraurelia strain d4-2]